MSCLCGNYSCEKCYPNREEEVWCSYCDRRVSVENMDDYGMCYDCLAVIYADTD